MRRAVEQEGSSFGGTLEVRCSDDCSEKCTVCLVATVGTSLEAVVTVIRRHAEEWNPRELCVLLLTSPLSKPVADNVRVKLDGAILQRRRCSTKLRVYVDADVHGSSIFTPPFAVHLVSRVVGIVRDLLRGGIADCKCDVVVLDGTAGLKLMSDYLSLAFARLARVHDALGRVYYAYTGAPNIFGLEPMFPITSPSGGIEYPETPRPLQPLIIVDSNYSTHVCTTAAGNPVRWRGRQLRRIVSSVDEILRSAAVILNSHSTSYTASRRVCGNATVELKVSNYHDALNLRVQLDFSGASVSQYTVDKAHALMGLADRVVNAYTQAASDKLSSIGVNLRKGMHLYELLGEVTVKCKQRSDEALPLILLDTSTLFCSGPWTVRLARIYAASKGVRFRPQEVLRCVGVLPCSEWEASKKLCESIKKLNTDCTSAAQRIDEAALGAACAHLAELAAAELKLSTERVKGADDILRHVAPECDAPLYRAARRDSVVVTADTGLYSVLSSAGLPAVLVSSTFSRLHAVGNLSVDVASRVVGALAGVWLLEWF